VVEYVHQIKRFRREIRLFLVFNLFANIAIGVFALIYNLYLVSLSHREDFIGSYNAVYTLAMAGAALIMGPLIGRFGNWACLIYGTAVFLIASLVLALVHQSWVILATSVIAGGASAFVVVPVMPFLVEWARPETRSVAAAVTFSIQSLSATVGSLIGGWSPRLISTLLGVSPTGVTAYRLTLIAGVALGVLAIVPLWRMKHARGHRAGETGQALIVSEATPQRRTVRRHITMFVLAGLILSIGSGAVVPFYNVYLASIGAGPSQIGLIYALAGIVAAIVGLGAPAIGRRFGPLGAEALLRLLPVPFFLVLPLVPGLGLALIAHIVRMTAVSVAWPINSTFISELLPSRARANAFSLRSGVWNLGYAAASLLAGQLIVAAGYNAIFIIFALSQAGSTAVFTGYFSRVRQHAAAQATAQAEPATPAVP